MLNVHAIRTQFPAINELYNGRPAIFFDNPGGTQVPQGVIDALVDYLTRRNANTHGLFETSRRGDQVIDHARQAAADLLGAETQEIIFGANMTTLTFHLARALTEPPCRHSVGCRHVGESTMASSRSRSSFITRLPTCRKRRRAAARDFIGDSASTVTFSDGEA